MKSSFVRPLFIVAAFILVTGLACNAVTGSVTKQVSATLPASDTKTPLPKPTKKATSTPIPPTDIPATDVPSAPDFFTEEFDGDLSNWSYVVYGDEKQNSISIADGKVHFEINEQDAGIIVLYEPYIYTDVKIGVHLENSGRNTINVTLLCRYSEDKGFYQAIVTSDGRYRINAYDGATQQSNLLFDGASNAIHQGKSVNEYELSCVGNNITLYANGTKVRSVDDTQVKLDEGQVGIYVGAIADIIPVIVDLDWFDISLP